MIPVCLVWLFFVFMAKDAPVRRPTYRWRDYAAVFAQPDTAWFCFIYSITFGGFSGLASYLSIFYHDQYGLTKIQAGDLTTLVVVFGSFLRPVGGLLSDRIGGVRMLQVLLGGVALCLAAVGTLPPVAAAVAYAGPDAVRFALARMPPPGAPLRPALLARQVLDNPAYAVRYAHAATAAVLRWAASLGREPAGFQPRQLTAPPELALLDALSWLPERVAMAARRGRPDEFAGYLEELAARATETMSTTGFTTIPSISSERLWLADATRTALAAGLGLLGVSAPERI